MLTPFHVCGMCYPEGERANSTFLGHHHSFGPEDIASMSAADETVLSKLKLVGRKHPAAMAVAKLIIELAKQGERDPARLCALALKRLSRRMPGAFSNVVALRNIQPIDKL